MVLNTALSSYRKPRPSIEYVEIIPEYHSVGDRGFSENEEQLYHAIRILNDTEKALLSLYLEDFSYWEIAEITGISENNVGVRLNRIKNKLIKLIK